MPDDGYFEDKIRTSKNKHQAAVGALVILASAATAAGAWLVKKNRGQKIAKLKTELSTCLREIEARSKYFEDLFSADYFVLDSNVWMDPEADTLFYLLRAEANRYQGRISVLESQVKEIDRQKKPAKNSGLAHNEGKHGRARHALKRIEEFGKAGQIRMLDDTSIAAGRTHVDEIFIDYFLRGVSVNETVRFVSDDRGLRILSSKVEAARPGLHMTIDRAELIGQAGGLELAYRHHDRIERELRLLGGD